MEFSATEKLRAIEREIAIRKHVYPGRIATGRMSDRNARYQMQIFEAIKQDYETLAEKETLL